MTQLDLITFAPLKNIIPFPASGRVGHAKKIARQLAKARTNKQADWIITRALGSYHDKLFAAGISALEADRQMETFRALIFEECVAIDSVWLPVLDHSGQGGGAA